MLFYLQDDDGLRLDSKMAQPRAHFTKWLMILRYAREGGKLIHSAKGKERSRRLQHASGFSSGNWKFSDKKRLLMNLGVDWREPKMPFHVGKPLIFFSPFLAFGY